MPTMQALRVEKKVMSVPDHLLDEPDVCLCEEHGTPRPCRMCRNEREMERWEMKREQTTQGGSQCRQP